MIEVDIAELLPHEGKMVLLDKVIDFDEKSMLVELKVRNDGLFGNDGSVPAWIGIEYMAQTVAAHRGMIDRIAGRPVKLGFLLGTRRFISNVDAFKMGAVLKVKVEKLIQDQGLAVFNCQITGEGVSVLAKLNVFQPESAVNRVITEEKK